MLIDTHCHIHDFNLYTLNPDETIIRAHEAGVMQMICIGTNVTDSRVAVKFASSHEEVYASVGAHPHELKDGLGGLEEIIKSGSKKIVAIGEIGLDYHTSDTPHDEQIQAFETQIQLALKYDLPIIFHRYYADYYYFCRCPPLVCGSDTFTCPDGTIAKRDLLNNCDFEPCPTLFPTFSPDSCPDDMFQCPDGTFVGRIPPNCE